MKLWSTELRAGHTKPASHWSIPRLRASDWLMKQVPQQPSGRRAMFKCDDTAVFYSIQGFHTIKLCTITKRAGPSERILFYCRQKQNIARFGGFFSIILRGYIQWNKGIIHKHWDYPYYISLVYIQWYFKTLTLTLNKTLSFNIISTGSRNLPTCVVLTKPLTLMKINKKLFLFNKIVQWLFRLIRKC